MAVPKPCVLEVGYTTADDGVWLCCDAHGDVKNLGHWPSVATVNEEVAAHLKSEDRCSNCGHPWAGHFHMEGCSDCTCTSMKTLETSDA